MDSAEELLKQKIDQVQQIAANNKNVDVGALMAAALSLPDANQISKGWRRWGYFVSFAMPPFGILFVLKFLAFDRDKVDVHRVVLNCLYLTLVSIVLTFAVIALLGKVIISSSGTNLQQIEQIDPNMVRQILNQ